eukprot:CAMPEP_0119046648 /NCGR_PEP_ID=MMETSP1177-20130426/47975_1 /TAXON_ID=2985 /ORGANISM="Ochromonas sp, Strain CCMP1899" /LENGTH=177 /DNA_ID=CAMNT_0007020095 /DNA_START=219 /DNA_END=749 /DNA_ORIENTATION=-
MSSQLKANERKRSGKGNRKNEDSQEDTDRDVEGLWGADMTVIQSLPILWDLTGETCREIAKQTAGVSLEGTDIKARLEILVVTWGRLSRSVLLDCTEGAEYLKGYNGSTSPNVPQGGKVDVTDLGGGDGNHKVPSASEGGGGTSKKARARAKAKINKEKIKGGILGDADISTEGHKW